MVAPARRRQHRWPVAAARSDRGFTTVRRRQRRRNPLAYANSSESAGGDEQLLLRLVAVALSEAGDGRIFHADPSSNSVARRDPSPRLGATHIRRHAEIPAAATRSGSSGELLTASHCVSRATKPT
jgi:hypothetical protein